MFYSQPGIALPQAGIWKCGRPHWRKAMTVAGIEAQTAFHIDAVRFAVGKRTLLGPVSLELQRSIGMEHARESDRSL
jgi:hypothetical protein